ncbi:unnamed protein product [Didymodactylos carnosus]|uniref:Uncharacterized protein n=1 Tax=Didymodactylos carnosus TaxID=1234261 RepID=A0A815H496_9BILA|nr:unnamed protein product [Didymodactylos carnosus]CAF4217442.1 unnamed protein product [Didymodactylos carnosus]
MEMERNHEKQRQDEDKARQRYGHYNPARQGFYLFPSLTIIAVIISLGVAIHGLQSRLMKVTDTHNSSRRAYREWLSALDSARDTPQRPER